MKAAQANEDAWHDCPTCKQGWTGKLQLQLCRERWRLASGRPEDDDERLSAGTSLVVSLRVNGAPVEALKLGRTNLDAHRRAYGGEDPDTLRAMAALAQTLSEDSLDCAVALAMQTEIIAVKRRLAALEPEYFSYEYADIIRLANTHSRMGNHQLALPLYQEVVDS